MKTSLLFLLVVSFIFISGCAQQENIQISEDDESKAPKEPKISEETQQTQDDHTSPQQPQQGRIIADELKSIQNPGYTERIDVSDGIVASLSRDRIIAVVDITNPDSPILKKTLDTPGFTEAIYKDNYYYIGDSKEFQIYDNLNSQPIGVYKTDFWVATFTVKNGLAYLAAGDQLLILDVKDPKNVKKISLTSLTGRAPSKVIIKDGYAYVVETLGGLNIVDVKDPANPKVVKILPFESHTVGFEIIGNYAYLARIASTQSTATGFTENSVFEVIDIFNPNSASVVGSLAIPATVRNLDAEGNYAYVIGGYPYLLTVIDISTKNPTIVKTLGSIPGGGDVQGIVVEKGRAFIADGLFGLRVIDISNPSNLKHLIDLDLQGRAFNTFNFGNELFLGVERKYFNLGDVSNPENPKLLYSENFTASYEYTSVILDKKKLYFNAGGARIYDVSNANNPQKLNQDTIGADSLQLQGNHLYSTIGEIGLIVYDVLNPASATLISKTPFKKGIPRDLSVDGRWAVGISNAPYSISVLDITDPKKPVAKDVYKYQEYPNSVFVKNDYAYVARGGKGVDILKINSDGSLKLVKNLPVKNGFANHAFVSNNQLFVVRDGVDVYVLSDLENPKYKMHVNNKGEAVRAAIANNYVYFADGYAGVTIANLS